MSLTFLRKIATVMSVFALSMFFTTSTPVSAATILVNGSFEDLGGQTLSNGSWGILPSLPGWNTTAGLEVQTAGTIGLTPQDGNNYVELDAVGNTIAAQTPTLAVGRYMLTFWYSPRVASQTADIIYGVAGLASGSAAAANYIVGTWTQVTMNFQVKSAGSYLTYFGGAGNSDGLGGLIDNVSISAVPIPASALMLIAALGGLAAFRRHKNTSPRMMLAG